MNIRNDERSGKATEPPEREKGRRADPTRSGSSDGSQPDTPVEPAETIGGGVRLGPVAVGADCAGAADLLDRVEAQLPVALELGLGEEPVGC